MKGTQEEGNRSCFCSRFYRILYQTKGFCVLSLVLPFDIEVSIQGDGEVLVGHLGDILDVNLNVDFVGIVLRWQIIFLIGVGQTNQMFSAFETIPVAN